MCRVRYPANYEKFQQELKDESVRAVNEQLSHPEQVKRWIVARQPLTVGAGELAPNLKARRNNIVQTRAALIGVLYDNWGESHEDTAHCGEVKA